MDDQPFEYNESHAPLFFFKPHEPFVPSKGITREFNKVRSVYQESAKNKVLSNGMKVTEYDRELRKRKRKNKLKKNK